MKYAHGPAPPSRPLAPPSGPRLGGAQAPRRRPRAPCRRSPLPGPLVAAAAAKPPQEGGSLLPAHPARPLKQTSLAISSLQAGLGYGIGFGVPTALFGAAILVFVAGAAAGLYVYVPPEGSPLRRIARVLRRALITNRRAPLPDEQTVLYGARARAL
jgi:hypothetical protein